MGSPFKGMLFTSAPTPTTPLPDSRFLNVSDTKKEEKNFRSAKGTVLYMTKDPRRVQVQGTLILNDDLR